MTIEIDKCYQLDYTQCKNNSEGGASMIRLMAMALLVGSVLGIALGFSVGALSAQGLSAAALAIAMIILPVAGYFAIDQKKHQSKDFVK